MSITLLTRGLWASSGTSKIQLGQSSPLPSVSISLKRLYSFLISSLVKVFQNSSVFIFPIIKSQIFSLTLFINLMKINNNSLHLHSAHKQMALNLISKSALLHNQNLLCLAKGHKKMPITLICLEQSCKSHKLCCQFCLYDQHRNHETMSVGQLQRQLVVESKCFKEQFHEKSLSLQQIQKEWHSNKIQFYLEQAVLNFKSVLQSVLNNFLDQLHIARQRTLNSDIQFTQHYLNLNKRLVQLNKNKNIQFKVDLLLQLKSQNSHQLFKKAAGLSDHCLTVMDQIFQRFKKDFDKKLNKIYEDIGSMQSWGVFGINFAQYSNPLTIKKGTSKYFTPVKRRDSITITGPLWSVSKQISNQKLLRTLSEQKDRNSLFS